MLQFIILCLTYLLAQHTSFHWSQTIRASLECTVSSPNNILNQKSFIATDTEDFQSYNNIQPWRWRQYVSPKRWHLPMSLYGFQMDVVSYLKYTKCGCNSLMWFESSAGSKAEPQAVIDSVTVAVAVPLSHAQVWHGLHCDWSVAITVGHYAGRTRKHVHISTQRAIICSPWEWYPNKMSYLSTRL
jgi:hypothetical protein